MAAPENREEVGVGAKRRVEVDPNHLGVVGVSGADELVIGIGYMTLRVANLRLHHTLHTLERQLHTPEAPGTELGQFQTRFDRTV